MKIWFGYGSEHSMNLVMIGEFKSDDAAERVRGLFDRITTQSRDDEAAKKIDPAQVPTKFTDGMMEILMGENLMMFSLTDPIEFLYDYSLEQDGNRLILTTEEYAVAGFMKLMLDGEAKVEIYSAHNHPSEFGRQTYTD